MLCFYIHPTASRLNSFVFISMQKVWGRGTPWRFVVGHFAVKSRRMILLHKHREQEGTAVPRNSLQARSIFCAIAALALSFSSSEIRAQSTREFVGRVEGHDFVVEDGSGTPLPPGELAELLSSGIASSCVPVKRGFFWKVAVIF